MQVPAVANAAVVPLTVQTPVVSEAKLTGRPEVAVADKVNGVPTVCVAGVLNVIVCGRRISVTVAVPERLEAVALMVTLGEDGMVAGAVNNPVELILPAEADHVTCAEALAVNCWVPLNGTFTVDGETVTVPA